MGDCKEEAVQELAGKLEEAQKKINYLQERWEQEISSVRTTNQKLLDALCERPVIDVQFAKDTLTVQTLNRLLKRHKAVVLAQARDGFTYSVWTGEGDDRLLGAADTLEEAVRYAGEAE